MIYGDAIDINTLLQCRNECWRGIQAAMGKGLAYIYQEAQTDLSYSLIEEEKKMRMRNARIGLPIYSIYITHYKIRPNKQHPPLGVSRIMITFTHAHTYILKNTYQVGTRYQVPRRGLPPPRCMPRHLA
jgi:hypothetical protein